MSDAPQGTTFIWTVTAPNPRSPTTGWDAGQRGWRLHAIPAQDGEEYQAYKRRPAMCGLWPRHGWGSDLFIEDECARCDAAMTKREKAGEVFVDLADIYRARREEAERLELKAYMRASRSTSETSQGEQSHD